MTVHGPHHVRVLSRLPGPNGAWSEHLKDDDPHFVQRQFLPSQTQKHRDVVQAFGTDQPHSGDVLLQYAGDPAEVRHETPVLLIHGSKMDGEFFSHGPKGHGLAQELRDQGFRVFACTFAHNQDDNYLEAQQVANLTERIRQVTGSRSVDLVGHSKGCLAATVYATPDFHQDWMSDYAGDVRKMLLLGGPNGGIDYFHRHPSHDLGASNWPMTWNVIRQDGQLQDCRSLTMQPDGYWPGHAQMAARWDGKYPLKAEERPTYEGAHSPEFDADGIDKAIDEGGHFVERLNRTPLANGIEVGLIAGNLPTVPRFQNETDGPSDGIVLVDSALQAPAGAHVTLSEVLPCNHMDLVLGRQAQQHIAQFLA